MITPPQEDKYIYTDGIDYSKTVDSSVWGTEEDITLDLLNKSEITGKWLNLCAGDGRFNTQLLRKADEVTAADIDESALAKLVRITPDELKNKLKTKVINVTEHFPFKDQVFDGIFCVGTLHLFPKNIFKQIFAEMDRVTKSKGTIIIDFAADVKRTYPDGSLWVVKNEPNYTLVEARDFLKDIFKNYQMQMLFGKSEPENVTLEDRTYAFSCNYIVLKAIKP